MVVYRGWKAVYMGLKRWRIQAPNYFVFDIKAHNVICLIEKIERWRTMEWASQN